ncbi:TPA: histone-like nucleoid-structuring protein, MvaT/MvaU family [Pseudomonas aeruginosa]|uniref:histone-like nucleoid-structuring protein, MvaT/MvaU family n=1 Tax=Pseudomonas aeruginosa TaxID=287 RepID=UPI000B329160
MTEPTRNGKRRPRELKTYKNPHTNEFVQTKGGNNRVLNEWKAEYGAEAVKSWLQS